jgi:hypothetical protein
LNTKLLYFGPQWVGSTSVQRLRAFQQLPDVDAVGADCGATLGKQSSLWRRIRWKLRLPVDSLQENENLVRSVREHRPDIVLVDNSKVITRRTLDSLRALGSKRLVYYTPDDIAARHNLSLPLKWSLPYWDIVCTTKTFNIPELQAMGAKRPLLIGKAFDPMLHHPLHTVDVGAEFERFDAVFIGTHERERCASINALGESGVSIVVYGGSTGGWHARMLHNGITLRPPVFDLDYVKAWHTGKVALCFLRKINRDRITQRTMEIAAIGKPMVAERTDEHDQHFQDGKEYLGFSSDAELVRQVRGLLDDPERRARLGAAGRHRCINGGYSTIDRARQMLAAFLAS